MTELERLAAALASPPAGGAAVLATLARVDGSAYRGVGARLVVRPDGAVVGAISGGCLEKDVAAHAERVRDEGRPRLVHYDLTSDDDAPWGLGMGCHARLDVLLEPAAGVPPWLEAVLAAHHTRRPVLLATALADGTPVGDLAARAVTESTESLPAALVPAARTAMDTSRAREAGSVLLEPLAPPIAVAACGDGPDIAPVLALADALGWSGRQVSGDDAPGPLDRRAAVLIMTHRWSRDVELAEAALRSDAGYIGILGPRSRSQRLLAALADRGLRLDQAARARLHTPVGLDIGAESPGEIALAALAEVRAVFAGRDGGSLARRDGPIHDR